MPQFVQKCLLTLFITFWCTDIHFCQVTGNCGLKETEAGKSDLEKHARVNPLNAELNPTCHLLVLLGAHHILHFSRVKVKHPFTEEEMKTAVYKNMQNLSKNKGEEKLRWDKNTAERGFKNECQYGQSSVHIA